MNPLGVAWLILTIHALAFLFAPVVANRDYWEDRDNDT